MTNKTLCTFGVALFLLVASGCSTFTKLSDESYPPNLVEGTGLKRYTGSEPDSLLDWTSEDLQRRAEIAPEEKPGFLRVTITPLTKPLLLATVNADLQKKGFHFKEATELAEKARRIYTKVLEAKWALKDTALEQSSCFELFVSSAHKKEYADPSLYPSVLKTEDGKEYPLEFKQWQNEEWVSNTTYYNRYGAVGTTSVPFFKSYASACTQEEIPFDRAFTVTVQPTFPNNIVKKPPPVTFGWLRKGSDFGRVKN